LELLETKAELLVVRIYSNNCAFNFLSDFEFFSRVDVLTCPRKVRNVNEGIHFFPEVNEETEVDNSFHCAFNCLTNWVFVNKSVPWIWHELLKAERDTLVLNVYFENNRFYFFT